VAVQVNRPRIVRGKDRVTLEAAVKELLPTTGSVEVQRDTPEREHGTHDHPNPETLLIVEGAITFRWQDKEAECGPGDRLLLPQETPHSSVAGRDGCLYIIATRIVEP
jgi:uncharacterized protein